MLRVREIIKKYHIRPVKSLGQNFLIDESVVRKIADAAEINPTDTVLEVGPGVGSLTRELALRAGRVIAVEIDRRLIPALSENLEDLSNVEIIQADILKTDAIIRGLSPTKVAANLPYYITTPIVMKLLEELPDADVMVFMVQKEVARRMVAGPGGKDYGALSVAVQFYSSPRCMFDVSPHCFIPQPDVDSAVVKLAINKTPPVELQDRELFFKTVRASFGQRRKKLFNALFNSKIFPHTREELKEILKNLGIHEDQRGETLTLLQFAQLSNSLSKKA